MRGVLRDLGAIGAAGARLLWAVASAITGWTVQLMGLTFLACVAVALLFRVLE